MQRNIIYLRNNSLAGQKVQSLAGNAFLFQRVVVTENGFKI